MDDSSMNGNFSFLEIQTTTAIKTYSIKAKLLIPVYKEVQLY